MKNLNTLTYDQIIKMSQDTSLDVEDKLQVDNYLLEIKDKINNLEFIDKLGLKFENNINGQVLSRSNSGRRIDFLAIFFGLFSIPILGLALSLLAKNIVNENFTASNVIPIAVLLLIGTALFSLILKGWKRKLMFKDFSLEKNSSNFKVRHTSNNKLSETVFSLDSKLTVLHEGEEILFVLIEENIENVLFTLPKLNTIQNETLNALVARFNEQNL